MPPARIEVVCRVRPTDKPDAEHMHILGDNVSIQVTRPARSNANEARGVSGRAPRDASQARTLPHTSQCFTFDRILNGAAASQENVYLVAAAQLVEGGLLNGTSATLLCYGERGSGKTHTMFGSADYRSRGVAPRAIHQLYAGITAAAEDYRYSVAVTFLQIFGDQVVDLLGNGTRGQVTLNGRGEVVLKGIERRPCQSEAEALTALFEGLQMHRSSPVIHSKYSHLVVSLYVQRQSLADSCAETRQACLHLIDLAGTQRVDNVTSSDERNAVQQVNRSLSLLEQVVVALAGSGTHEDDDDGSPVGSRGGCSHIPYRQSKLTTLLKDCIGGRCRTTLIAHVSIAQGHLDATTATLNFAKRMMCVASDPKINTVMDAESQVRHLQRQVTDLKTELRLQAQLNAKPAAPLPPTTGSRGGDRRVSVGAPFQEQTSALMGVDELSVLHERVQAYIEGGMPTLQVSDVREMQACFACLRGMIEHRDVRIAELKSVAAAVSGGGGSMAVEDSSRDTNHAKGGGRGKRMSSQVSTGRANTAVPQPESTYTPNVLDLHAGVTYGTAAKAKITVATVNSMSSPAPNVYWAEQRPEANHYGEAPLGTSAATTQQLVNNRTVSSEWPPSAVPPTSRMTVTWPNTATASGGSSRPLNPSRPPLSTPQRPQRPASASRPRTADCEESSDPMSDAATSLLQWKTQRAINLEKSAAFEAYKVTPSGSMQLAAMQEDQRLVSQRQAAVQALEERYANLQAALEIRENLDQVSAMERATLSTSCRISAGGSSMRPSTRLSSRSNGSMGTVLPMLIRGGDTIQSGAAVDRGLLVTQMAKSTPLAQISSSAQHAQDELTKTMSERLQLLRQLDRRRVAFLNNFEEWYAQTVVAAAHSMEGTRLGSHTRRKTSSAVPAAANRVQSYEVQFLNSVENNPDAVQDMLTIQQDRFMDASERFDAMEVQRQVTQDPDSAAYFTAKKLIGTRGRLGRRPSTPRTATYAVTSR